MKRRIVGIALFCLVLLAAIFAGYWDMLNTEKMRIASEEAASKSQLAAGDPAPAQGPSAPPSAAGDAAPRTPTFDILRVEPDGSTIMAGKAAAGATVRLTDGTNVLGEEKAGPGGDFAIILDKPLSIGEHQIKIEASDETGTAATSRETAIVSVPERGRETELLAMVETPDQPSRLISVPTGEAAPVPDASQAPSSQPTMAGGAAAASAVANPGSGSVSSTPSGSGGTAMPAVAEPGDADDAAAQPNLAAAPETAPTRSPNLVAEGTLAVEAVEIEDETIYVAGRAPVGPTIRVYVDNVFLAEDAGRRTDRFLVSTLSAITPGNHMVRADQVAPDGSVTARVEVPFVKPEGRSMSAVAGASTVEPGSVSNEGAPSAGASGERAGNDPGLTAPAEPATSGTEQMPQTAAASPQATSERSGAASATTGVTYPATGTPAEAAPGGVAPPEIRAEPAPGAASSELDAGGSELAAARQAPLQASGARVIIRRGDTLWRISREVYGRGARYTTIYLANGDQIRNPDRIYPGQVFRMPDGAAQ